MRETPFTSATQSCPATSTTMHAFPRSGRPGLWAPPLLSSALLLALCLCIARAEAAHPAAGAAPVRSAPVEWEWGQPLSTPFTTTYGIYAQDFTYGDTPLLITDLRDGDLYLDKESYEIRALTVYRPHDGTALLEDRPVVFFVHGGGWVDGYRETYEFVAYSLTGEEGWVTVVIDYRLTSDQVFLADAYCPDRATCNLPENVPLRTKAAWYPDNAEDVADAFQWTLDHIAQHGGDPGQVAVFGHSAGAHLASLLPTHTAYSETLRPRIGGLVSMSGGYQLSELNQAFWGGPISQTFPGGFSNTALLEEASPSTYVTGGLTLPPFYLLYAEDDLLSLTEQSIVFEHKLTSLGYEAEITYLAGYGHVSEMAALAYADEWPTQLIVDFIERALGLRYAVYLPLVAR